jgi:hypothetical protein
MVVIEIYAHTLVQPEHATRLNPKEIKVTLYTGRGNVKTMLYRVFKKCLYNYESFYTFIQRT